MANVFFLEDFFCYCHSFAFGDGDKILLHLFSDQHIDTAPRRVKNPFPFPTIPRPMLPARITLSPGPELRCSRSAKREEGPSRILNRGAMGLPRGGGGVSAVEVGGGGG